jgi:hypothetical protein
MRKTNSLYFIIPVANSLLVLVIPDYYFWFAVALIIGAITGLIIFLIDIVKRTNRWKYALKLLGLGIGSYILGVGLIMIRNYFLGYYSK